MSMPSVSSQATNQTKPVGANASTRNESQSQVEMPKEIKLKINGREACITLGSMNIYGHQDGLQGIKSNLEKEYEIKFPGTESRNLLVMKSEGESKIVVIDPTEKISMDFTKAQDQKIREVN